MKLFIVALDEPIYYYPFFKTLFESYAEKISGFAILTYTPKWQKDGLIFKRILRAGILGLLVYGLKNLFKRIGITAGLALGLLDKKRYSVIGLAESFNIATEIINDVNHPDFVNRIKAEKIDVLIFQGYQKLGPAILEAPAWGCLNRHSGPLPKYRGSFAIFWGMYFQESQFGVSVHKMTEKFDEGRLLTQKVVSRKRNDTIATLYDKTNQLGANALVEALGQIENQREADLPNEPGAGSIFRTPSLKNLVSYCLGRRRSK
tara:strand:- start:260 stop:1042 length:783 start_codon:yes stop_codon:yes gene_type:complete